MGDGGGSPRDPEAAEPSPPAERSFGRRGWVLVVAVFLAFVVAPAAISLWPPDVPFVFAYLVLALIPGVLLALVAVWATAGR